MSYFAGHASLGDVGHYWEMEESSGTRTSQTASAFQMLDFNTVTREAGLGPGGYAARFTRANSELLYRDSTTFNTSFSISCWVYPITDPGASFVGIHGFGAGFPTATILCVYRWNLSPGSVVTLCSDSSGGFQFTYNSGSSYNLIYNQWNWLLVTYDETDKKIRSRINGTATQTSTALASTRYNTAQQWDIGYCYLGGSSSPYFDGRIAEYAYWGRALTESEMDALYASGSGLFYRSPSTDIKTGSTVLTSGVSGAKVASLLKGGSTAGQSGISGSKLISMYKTGSTVGSSVISGRSVRSLLKSGSTAAQSTVNGPRVSGHYKAGAVAAQSTLDAIMVKSLSLFGDIAAQSAITSEVTPWINYYAYLNQFTNRKPEFETKFNRRAVYPGGRIKGWRGDRR
jgi:hypothetical protein